MPLTETCPVRGKTVYPDDHKLRISGWGRLFGIPDHYISHAVKVSGAQVLSEIKDEPYSPAVVPVSECPKLVAALAAKKNLSAQLPLEHVDPNSNFTFATSLGTTISFVHEVKPTPLVT